VVTFVQPRQLVRRCFSGAAVSLNITVLAPRIIYQSGDFRLADRHGRPVEIQAQKQILVSRFSWSAVVAFAGVGSVGQLMVADWLAGRTHEIPQSAEFDALIDVLLTADDWLKRQRLQDRFHTFSVGAFVGHRPLFGVVSNFESVHARPSRVPRPKLHASYRRPRHVSVVVTGRPSAVLRIERQSLIGLIRAGASSEVVMNALAKISAAASTRETASISPRCFTSFARFTGEGGGMVHGLAGEAYVPSFMVPDQMKGAIDRLLKEQFPQGAQLRSFSSMRAEATDSYHRIQLREKPDDPSVHNNFGAYLANVKKDKAGAEAAYVRAIELDSDHPLALGNLANMLWDRGEIDRAEELHQRAFGSNPENVVARIKLARFLLRARSDIPAAIQLCEQGFLSENENAELLSIYCEALVRDGQYVAAAEHYRRLYELRPDSAEVALGYAASLQAMNGAPEIMEPLYRRVLEQEPENGVAMLNLAQLRYLLGAVEEAISLIRRSTALLADDGVKVEALFCWYAFQRDSEVLPEIKSLLSTGARSIGWDLAPIVERSVTEGHPEPEFLRGFGEAVTGASSLERLDAFLLWRQVTAE